jgi:hypothetical protein
VEAQGCRWVHSKNFFTFLLFRAKAHTLVSFFKIRDVWNPSRC